MNKHEWMETGRATKKYSSDSSVITHIIKSQERFLHFTGHLAFGQATHDDGDLNPVTSVVSSTSTTYGAALISFFVSFLIISPIASITPFWILFEKPENRTDISEHLAQWFSKFFFSYSPLTNPNTINSSPTKITKKGVCKNFTSPTVEKLWTIINQTDSFITSVTAARAACPYVL